MGRLDKDTTGLLLLTNDGALAHDLLSPKKHVDKTYLVQPDHPLSEEDIHRLEEGLDIGDDKPTAPAKAVMSLVSSIFSSGFLATVPLIVTIPFRMASFTWLLVPILFSHKNLSRRMNFSLSIISIYFILAYSRC